MPMAVSKARQPMHMPTGPLLMYSPRIEHWPANGRTNGQSDQGPPSWAVKWQPDRRGRERERDKGG